MTRTFSFLMNSLSGWVLGKDVSGYKWSKSNSFFIVFEICLYVDQEPSSGERNSTVVGK